MSQETIYFMLHKIIHFETFENRIIDLENKNVELEVDLRIVKAQLDKLTQKEDPNGPVPENSFENDKISADQEQEINLNESRKISAELNSISNESQDDENIENRDSGAGVLIENNSSEGIELTFTMRDIENFEENFKISPISTSPEIISISGGNDIKIFDGSSNPSLNWFKSPEVRKILQKVVIPLKRVDSDPSKFDESKNGKKVHKCAFCSREFQKFANFRRHFRIHTGEKPYSCPMCPKSFAFLKTFNRHSVIHSKKVIETELIKRKSDASDKLTTHGSQSSESRNYRCKICSKFFKSKSTFDGHLKVEDKCRNKTVECSTCLKIFTCMAHLKIHNRVHTGEKPYSCSVCPKKFSQPQSLGIHSRTHTGEKPYICKFCPKKFSQIASLVNHSRTHTGEKPYICKFCSKKFSQIASLVNHTRTHTREKPYSCSFCPKKFSDASNLRQHSRTHTGDRPYIQL